MPRKADAELENRVLEAAYKLWSKSGEKGLTMRAVAKAARTTTPTMYQRFRDKNDLMMLLRKRALEKLVSVLQPACSPAATCGRFLDFASSHPHQYRLVTADWAVRLSDREPRPTFELIKRRLAVQLGGGPEEHARLALALGALIHGTATMLLAEGVHDRVSRQLRSTCNEACDTLIQSAAAKRAHRNA
ncbi:MAG TPA: TetR/AcrR family transcriptional regulator [Candidatus Acidoferrales bacterium]|nr:TetR/AcrR family transcriptional regulator [Candidatus Acidoferrales bacterium]